MQHFLLEELARLVMGTIFLVIIIIIIHFFARVSECTEVVATSLKPLVTNFPEICAFIIGFSFTVLTKKFSKKIQKQVTECLQNLYKSAIHLKYVILVLL